MNAKVSQQNITLSIELLLPTCLHPILDPGSLFLPGQLYTCIQLSI